MVELSPAMLEARVQFPANANIFNNRDFATTARTRLSDRVSRLHGPPPQQVTATPVRPGEEGHASVDSHCSPDLEYLTVRC